MPADTLDRTIAPPVHAMPHLTMPRLKSRTLPNGMTLHTLDRGEDEVSRLSIVMPGGSVESPLPGLVELASQMALDGTLTRSAEEIADALDFNGAWARGADATHHHTFTVHSLNSRFDSVLPLVLDILANPSFPDHETAVEREKAVRTLELSQQKVTWHAQNAIRRLTMGPDCPLAVATTADGLRSITAAQLRELHRSTFAMERTHAFLTGRITSEIEAMTAEGLGSLRSTATDVRRRELSFRPSATTFTEKIERPGSLQTAVSCSIPTIGRRAPDYVALRMAVIVLGGYFGSRLMLNIREDKGYTYGIGAGLVGYVEGGFISIDTECDNRYTPAVLDEIRAELLRMHDPASYTAAELERARSFIATNLAAQLDSPFAVADYHLTSLIADTPADYFEQQQRALRTMTPESLADTARRYFDPERLYTALAGDNLQ